MGFSDCGVEGKFLRITLAFVLAVVALFTVACSVEVNTDSDSGEPSATVTRSDEQRELSVYLAQMQGIHRRLNAMTTSARRLDWDRLEMPELADNEDMRWPHANPDTKYGLAYINTESRLIAACQSLAAQSEAVLAPRSLKAAHLGFVKYLRAKAAWYEEDLRAVMAPSLRYKDLRGFFRANDRLMRAFVKYNTWLETTRSLAEDLDVTVPRVLKKARLIAS